MTCMKALLIITKPSSYFHEILRAKALRMTRSLFIAMTMCIILFQDYKPFKVITVNSGVAIKRMGI
jgi:hypothetical protein